VRKVSSKDKPIVQKILEESFKNDPFLSWLSNKSKSPERLKYIVEYVVDQTFENGEIYLSDNHMATALWNSEKKEKFTFNFIYRNLAFLFKMGIKATIDVVRKDNFTHEHYPKDKAFSHLFMVGVLPEAQGTGLASELMNPMIEKISHQSIPMYLETANLNNVEIYRKKGFAVFKTIDLDEITIYFMKR
jgi:ribosomal protein S18 acetylase RimI-like enzyme